MCLVDPYEIALWEKVESWFEGCHLREDAPQDVKDAFKELMRIAWDPDTGQ